MAAFFSISLKRIIMMNNCFKDTMEMVKVIEFLSEIGIKVETKKMTKDCFLPGLSLGPNVINVRLLCHQVTLFGKQLLKFMRL